VFAVKVKFKQVYAKKTEVEVPLGKVAGIAALVGVGLLIGGSDCEVGAAIDGGFICGVVGAGWSSNADDNGNIHGVIATLENSFVVCIQRDTKDFSKKSIKIAFNIPFQDIIEIKASSSLIFGCYAEIIYIYKQTAYKLILMFR